MNDAGISAMQLGLQHCEACGLGLSPGTRRGRRITARAMSHLEFRKKDSLNRTLAYLIAAAICYIPANILPIMRTKTLSHDETDTIMQGVVLLWSPTGWPLSLIILFASILIPSAKVGRCCIWSSR